VKCYKGTWLICAGKMSQMHCESGGGQFEMVVSHSPCLRAADNLLLLREAVTAVANKYSLHATFLPKWVYVSNENLRANRDISSFMILHLLISVKNGFDTGCPCCKSQSLDH